MALALALLAEVATISLTASSVTVTAKVEHVRSEFALNSAGFNPLALAKAFRIGSSKPVNSVTHTLFFTTPRTLAGIRSADPCMQ